MNILEICNQFGLGGTEKTMEIFSLGFKKKGYKVFACGIFSGGVRQKFLETFCEQVIILDGSIEKMRVFLDNNKIDLVHWHGFDSFRSHRYKVSLEILQLMKKKGIRVVETSPFSIYDRNLETLLDRRFFVSESSLVKFFWKYGESIGKKELYDFVYNPINSSNLGQYLLNQEQKIQVRKEYGIDKNDFVIGKIGRANLWKWEDTIIDIVHSITRYIPNLKIVIRAIPEQKKVRIKKAKLEKYFVLLPETVNEEELSHTYQIFDIMLHTSRIGESFGVSLVEAMFFGVPIITKDTDFMKFTFFDRDNSQGEIIKNTFNGFICSNNLEIIDKVLILFNDKALYKKISSQNKEASSRFFIEFIIEDFISKIFSPHPGINFIEAFKNYQKRTISEPYIDLICTNIKAIFEKFYFKI